MAYSFGQLLNLAQNAGFTGQSANTAAAIALAESNGNPNNINYGDPGGSFGLMQINQAAHPGTAAQALNPQGSFNLAYSISKGGTDFSPWSTFNSGAYQQYLAGGSPSSAPGFTSTMTISPTQNTGVVGDFGGVNQNVPTLGSTATNGVTPASTATQGTTNPNASSSGGILGTLGGLGSGIINLPGAIGGGISSVVGAIESWIGRGLVGLLAIVLIGVGLIWLAMETKTGRAAAAATIKAIK